jgi:hypothetical protein
VAARRLDAATIRFYRRSPAHRRRRRSAGLRRHSFLLRHRRRWAGGLGQGRGAGRLFDRGRKPGRLGQRGRQGLSPFLDADRVVAEINQGGDMVTAMLNEHRRKPAGDDGRATRGKFLRAEPVAALYEQGRVAHAGRFVALEDQMCDFGPGWAVVRPFAGPAGCAGLGADGADAGGKFGAAGAGCLTPRHAFA